MVEQWEQIKAREQKDAGQKRVAAERRAEGAAGAAARPRDRHARRGGRLRLGADRRMSSTRSRKRSPSCARRSTHEGSERAEEEMGDLLFSIANLARKLGIEPESALRKANEKFSAAVRGARERLRSAGRSVHDATLEEMEEVWSEVKES